MSTLSENIKKFRLKISLTQDELAQRLGKSKNVVSNWERGDNRPDADSIELMCKIFEVTPNDMYGWETLDGIKTTDALAAHFDGTTYTEDELNEIKTYAEFVKARKQNKK